TYKLKQKVDTSPKVASSKTKVDTSSKVATSKPKVDTSSNAKVDTSGKKLESRTKLTSEQLETEIMKICQKDYIKMEEVARAIDRSVDYLKNKIFPGMMKDGKLEKRFPFTHNHPEQGYKTSEDYAEGL